MSAQVDTIPIVGRAAELELLRVAIDAARLRQLQAVEIVADPGMGKSRLVRELPTLALGFQQLRAAVDPYAATESYSIWRDLLRPLVGITPERSREDAGEQLATWVQAVVPDLAPWVPLLALPFDATVPPTPETDALDPAHSRDRLHAAVETFLERVLMMPTLIVVEDTHWLDDASLFLLRHLFAKPQPRPWLLCVTARPAAESILSPGGPGTRLELQPLTDDDAEAFALAVAQSTRFRRRRWRPSRNAPAETPSSSASSSSRRSMAHRKTSPSRSRCCDDTHRHARAGRSHAAPLRSGRRSVVRAGAARGDPRGRGRGRG